MPIGMRRAVSTACVMAIAGLSVLAPAAQSLERPLDDEDPGEITCHGGGFNVQFNPGLTFAKAAVRLTGNGDLGICYSRKYPNISGGTFRVEAAVTGQCPGPIGPGYAKVVFHWSDGTQTVVPQATFRGEAFSFSFEGSQLSGLFAGQTARANGRTITNLIELGAGCVFGLTEYSAGIDQLAIGSI